MSLRLLLQSAGFNTEAFSSAADFLVGYRAHSAGCLIVDLNVRGTTGLDLQTTLCERGEDIPLLLLTDAIDSSPETESHGAGAVDFIEKPYKSADLLTRVNKAMSLHKTRAEHETFPKPPAGPVVYVVDDDDGVRVGTDLLLRSMGWATCIFASAEEFLEAYSPGEADCLLLDLHMPGMSGVALQEKLGELGLDIPIVIITAYRDDPLALRAKVCGAVDILVKPFRSTDLQAGIERALAPQAG